MRLTFICTDDGRKVIVKDGKDVLIYYAVFNSKEADKGKPVGMLRLESFEPMHYKAEKKYVIDINEHIGVKDIEWLGKA